MPNMPQPMSMPPTTSQQCITKEDANDPDKVMPAAPSRRRGAPPLDCKVTDQRIVGSTVTVKVTCAGDTPTTGTIEMTTIRQMIPAR